MLHLLSDEHLIEAYYSAIQLNLDKEFIRLLAEELEKRELKTTNKAPYSPNPIFHERHPS